MELTFENLLLIDHYIDSILNHINDCISSEKEIIYPNDGFNLAYILSSYRIFNEEEHLSLMTKWKYDSNLDLESANWLIEYYLFGKDIIKSYLEENIKMAEAEFNCKDKNDIINNLNINDKKIPMLKAKLLDDYKEEDNYKEKDNYKEEDDNSNNNSNYNSDDNSNNNSNYNSDDNLNNNSNNNSDDNSNNNSDNSDNSDNTDDIQNLDEYLNKNIDDIINAFPNSKKKGKIIIK